MTSTETAMIDLTQWAGIWKLDPAKTFVNFRTKAMRILPVKGTAKALSGTALIKPDGSVSGTVIIDAASLDTRSKKRDNHLRSEDFLEVVKYPTIAFTANGCRPLGADRVEISGVLTVRSESRPLRLPARLSWENECGTVSTEVELDRSEWGVSWAKMGASLNTHLKVQACFERA